MKLWRTKWGSYDINYPNTNYFIAFDLKSVRAYHDGLCPAEERRALIDLDCGFKNKKIAKIDVVICYLL